ncbi:MAG: signal recognition particle receptor subunit alpha, partial [Bacteroidota bacterium]
MLNFFKKKENKEKLDQGLEKTKSGFFSRLSRAIAGKSKVDDAVLDDLEEVLIASDVGVKTTIRIIERIEARVAKDKYTSASELDRILKDEIKTMILESHPETRNYFE